MKFQKLVERNRSYRRFYEDIPVESRILRNLINFARLTPSASNKQPLKYILSNKSEMNSKIFSTLVWAASLPDWPGPDKGERPSAYIIILGDKQIAENWSVDPGIVMQTMLLSLIEIGLGGCMFGSIKRKEMAEELGIPSQYEILYVLALGKPKEKVVLEDVKDNNDIRYYRDENKVHHVPKRALDDLIIEL